jgi:hypothetical protein
MKTITLRIKNALLLIGLLLITMIGNAQTTQIFNASGTFTAPAGVSTVQVEAWGGGGAGGGNTTTNDGAGGGGGGAYSKTPAIGVTSGSNYTVTIGAAGAGTTGTGGVGGDTWFNTSGTILAKGGAGGLAPVGGAGGVGGVGGSSATSVGTTKYSGGNGGTGKNSGSGIGGPGGSSAGTAAVGVSGALVYSTATAAAAPAGGGKGGNGGASGANGGAASTPGGGGGGSGDGTLLGGAGAVGKVILTYTCPTYALTSAASSNGPLCGAGGSIITLRSSSMPSGTYTITYNLSGATTATGNTSTMTFTAGSPGTGTFSTSGVLVGTTNVTVTNIASGGCNNAIGTNNTASVLVNPILFASVSIAASPAGAVCAGTNVTFTATPTNPGTITTYQWKVGGVNVGTNSTTYATNTLVTGNSVTCVMVSNATCVSGSPATSNAIVMTVNSAPTAVAGTAISQCYTSGAINITAGSSATNYSSVTWTSSGTGTFATPNSLTTCTYTPSAADRTAGGVTLTLTAVNAGCTTAISTKALSLATPATSAAGTAIIACATSGAVNICAGASASNYSAVTWTSNGSGVFTNPNSLTTCTYTPSAADISAGSVSLTLTATANTPCSDAISTKPMTVNSPPTAVAGFAIYTCSTTGPVNVTLGSSAANASSILWTSSGTGTFANATSLTTCTYTPSAADITAGNITLTLTATTAGCGTDSSTKNVRIYTTPTITGTTPATRTGAGTVILGATASTGSLNWYAAATGGASLGFGSTFTTPSISTTTTYYVEALNGTCPSNPRTAVIATIIYPEIDIKGNAVTIADADNTPSAADWTDFGSTNATRTFTVYNTGSGVLSLGSVIISGVNASEFTLTSSPSVTVASGSSTSFTITFNPTAAGTRAATITLSNNDTDENPYDFSIQGTGVAQEIDIQGNAVSIADGDASATTADWTDFSTVTATRTFTIKNNGNIVLTVGAITFSGTNAGDFSVTTAPSATVAAYGSTTFVVTFSPSAINSRTATINIVNNDSNENPYDFAIQGFGVIPEVDVQGNATSIADGDTTPVTTDWTDFSTTNVTRTFTILNAGNTVLTVGAITFTGTNPGDFTVTTAPSASVAAFSSTTFTVTFNPGAVGARSAIIHIVNNDSTENPYDFTIQGTGVVQEIDIQGNATSIVDGDTTPVTTDWTDFSNAALTRTFTIYNTGNMPLTLGATSFTGTNPTEFAVTTAPVSPVPAFGSTTFVVTFTQAAIGTRSAIFHIVNNDSGENPYDITMQATGGTPEINIKSQYGVSIADGDTTPSTSDQTDFGNVSMDGGSVTVNLIIENTGTAAMSIGTATFSGTNASNFAMVSAPSSTIAAGANSRFKISFTPTTIGTKTATFSIVNNDSNENPYNFDLTGLGVQTYKDTDGDGVTDNKDADDDNDGIIDIKEQTDGLNFPLTSLVQYTFLNETFGAGTTKGLININTPGATCTYCYEDGYGSACDASVTLEDGEYCVNYKITGALATDPENIHGDLAWYDGLDHTTGDTDGRMAVFNASFAAGTFYETRIDGVIPNVPISYSFWVLNIMRQSNFVGSILPNITVEFVDLSNNLLSSFTTGDIGRCTSTATDNTCLTTNWLQFSTSVNLGNVTSFIVRFKNNSTGGGGNDLAIDDINIAQNYIDTDGDGIANIFDLDDENDGIPDVEEAGFKTYSSGFSKMNLASSATWLDTNVNGLNDVVDTQIAGGTYLIADTDGDGVPNYLDLDSDNDSLFDVDEAGTFNGDGDINGDGRGDLVDTDRDGILDLYDNNATFGTAVRTFAQDSDSNGVSDYLQLDSNNDGINDINTYLYGSLDANNDGKIDGSTDIDKDGILDSFDTNTSFFGSPRDLNRKLYLDFDGRNDYGQAASVLGGLSNASLMAWVDLGSTFATDGVVVGQDKFQVRITSGKFVQAIVNSTTLTFSTTALTTSRWYHVGAVYGGGFLKLYLNGTMVASVTAAGNIAADASLLTLGKNPVATNSYFNGKIDEVRVVNVALTDDQFQRMVYQEIQNTSSQVRGAIVPKDVGSLPWSNVLRYYRMDAYKDDIVDDLTTASIDTGTGMKIYNNKYIRVQQAPMPFITERTGTFSVAANSPTNDVRGADIMDQDWSIVQVKHNITETANNVDLGMFVDPGVTITMNNDTKIQNDWYLKLDGKIDLVDKSQLVQTVNSDLDVSSAGSIERDQKGQSNKYNYNYWASPVGTINSATNNTAFTVAGVMKDGTDASNPQNLQWTSGYDSNATTTPITLSSYWIFKFQNLSPIYANWASVGPNGSLLAGQGFTLKGSNAATATQNYTFVGKPNSGAISSPIAANYANLSGNPYASAIDADAFLSANSGSTTGTIYFWEHFPTNSSHNLIQYQGGYAARTMVGGTPPVAPAGISGMGTSTRTPKRFIPVGQGFLLYGSATGGNIVFNNSMRAFVKEDNATNSNILFRQQAGPLAEYDNREDTFVEDNYAKIRLGFNSQNGFHRQLLIGFMNERATNDFDPGYDAKQIDNQPNEMTFINGTNKLVIQGVGEFNEDSVYPLGVKTGAEGNISITLDGTENFEANQDIYIYDSVTEQYHDIRDGAFELNLATGSFDARFSLRFKSARLANNTFELQDEVTIRFTNSDNMINIKNDQNDFEVKSVSLFNILGQDIQNWDVKDQEQNKIQLPVKDVSTGTYIVKVHTTKGDISKKIIIK